MSEPLTAQSVRAAISNAYYETREAGGTMERAADAAAAHVMDLLDAARAKDSGASEGLRDAVAAMASVLVMAERDGMWPYYTAIARRAYDAAGGTLRSPVAASPVAESRHPDCGESCSCYNRGLDVPCHD